MEMRKQIHIFYFILGFVLVTIIAATLRVNNNWNKFFISQAKPVKAEEKVEVGDKNVDQAVITEIGNDSEARVMVKLQAPKSMNIAAVDFSDREYLNGYQAGVVNRKGLEQLAQDHDVQGIYIDQPVQVFGVSDSISLINADLEKYNLNFTGRGQKVCIIDTGLDYANQATLNYVNGYDFVNNDGDPYDDQGHGTLVARQLAAVAPGSDLCIAKVIDQNGQGYESTVLQGLQWCLDQQVDIINFSIGSGSYDGFCDANPVANLVNQAVQGGTFVAAATGNDSSQNLRAPSCATLATRVAASDFQDEIASFSNINLTVDLLAPSESGTSLSAALVSGAAALVLENETLNPSELKYRLRSTGKPISYMIDLVTEINISRLDVYNAVINKLTMKPYDYPIVQGTGNESNFTLLVGEGCGAIGDPDTCANGNSCCAYSSKTGIYTCQTAKSDTAGTACYSGDTASTTCAKSCTASGSAADVCTSTLYTVGAWLASTCCGDDTGEDYASAVDGANFCCEGVSTADDYYCTSTAGWDYDWQIDGVQCTTNVYALTGTITNGNDGLVCTCPTIPATAYACDSGSDTNGTVDGICTDTNVCTAANVARDASNIYRACSATYQGRQCDTNTAGGAYAIDSICLNGGTCDATDVVYSSSNYYSCAAAYEGVQCDASTSGGTYTADSLCLTSAVCDATEVVLSGTDYYSCGSSYYGNMCDSATTGTFTQDGQCSDASTCCTTEMAATSDCDCDDNDVTAEKACDNTVTSGAYAADGICANDGVGTADTDANCETSGVICIDSANTNRYTLGAAYCVDGDACDSALTAADYVADGLICNAQSLGCVVNGSRTAGQSCCATANCAGGLPCTAGTCQAAGPSLTGPASVSMSSYQLGGVGYSDYTFSAGELVVVTNAGASGWSLTVSSTNMTGTKNIITNADILLRTDGTLASDPTIITSSDSLTGVTETTSGNYALSSTRTIVTASAGNGVGTYNVRPTIRVNIADSRYAETDTATLTFTVQ